MVGKPVLHGTWHGELASDWVNPQTGKGVPPDPHVFLVVRQRFWSITVRMLTKESASSSLQAHLAKHDDGVHQLLYTYSNKPRREFRHRSEVHYGTAVLTAPRDPEQGVEGDYFTDRKTTGDMRFHTRYGWFAETHARAMELVAASSQSS